MSSLSRTCFGMSNTIVIDVLHHNCDMDSADRLKLVREARGITQADLAKLAGVSQGTIGNLEKRIRASTTKWPQIAGVLGVDPVWLTDGRGSPPDWLSQENLHEVAPMTTVEEIRLENLRALVRECGTAAALARRAGTAPSYLSQILTRAPSRTGKPRDVGADLARALEEGCGKPLGWMDQPHTTTNFDGTAKDLTEPSKLPTITISSGVTIAPEKGNVTTPPRPVMIFDDGDEMPEDMIQVPRLTLVLSAGNGHLQWEIDSTGAPNWFRKGWVRRKKLPAEALVTVRVDGDSMLPYLPNGASVTLNTADRSLRNGKVHAIDYMGEFFIKRLMRAPGGAVIVQSDNPDKTRFPDWQVLPEHGDVLRVLGACVAFTADMD